jgi:hypothetical protein
VAPAVFPNLSREIHPVSVYELSRKKWQEFKKTHDLPKSTVFKKADVGPTIDKFQVAVQNFTKVGGQKNLIAAFKKAEDLKKAFEKFINQKEAKDQLPKAAKDKITKWQGQLENVRTGLAQYQAAYKDDLKDEDKDIMVNDINKMFNWD